MLIKEYRICLPLSTDEYRIGQLYMIQKKSREESTGHESGVEIIKNEPYVDGPGGSGQYTLKIYHVGSHLPVWLRSLLPSSALRVEEEAWNAYPYTNTTYKVPFVGKFLLDIETCYHNDGGEQDNVFNLSADELKMRVVDFIDIVKDSVSSADYKIEEDPLLFVSKATGRGPLSNNWHDEHVLAQNVTHACYDNPPTQVIGSLISTETLKPLPKRIMCAYKLCRVEFKYWGAQTKVEQFIHDIALRKTMVKAHRQVWTWQDEWCGLTIEDIRRLEAETARVLDSKMGGSDVSAELVDENGPTLPKNDKTRRNTEHEDSKDLNGISEVEIASDAGEAEDVNLWSEFKKLESDNNECDEYEPFASFDDPTHIADDDALSYVTCYSEMTAETTYLTPSPSNMNCISQIDGNKCMIHKAVKKSGKMILMLVVHGGCLLDINYDLNSKFADVATFTQTIELVIANHYPNLREQIAIKLVPCRSEIDKIFPLLSKLKVPFNKSMENEFPPGLIPLTSLPLFLINSNEYCGVLERLASQLNTKYTEFLQSSEGSEFNGIVCLVADNIGSIMAHDLLNINAFASDQHSVAADNLCTVDVSVCRWKHMIHCPSEPAPNLSVSLSETTLCPPPSDSNAKCADNPVGSDIDSQPQEADESNSLNHVYTLAFHVHQFFMFGSPVGMILAFRNQNNGSSSYSSSNRSPNLSPSKVSNQIGSAFRLAADSTFNLLHAVDPSAFRAEPVLDSRFAHISPLCIPRYVHYPLGDGKSTNLIETIAENANKVFHSTNKSRLSQHNVKCNSVYTKPLEWESQSINTWNTFQKVRQNWWGEKRVDYIVHAPVSLHGISNHISPTILHASYWESKDVVAFILRQLLDALGLSVLETSYAVDMADDVALCGLAKLSLRSPQPTSPTLSSSAVSTTPMTTTSILSHRPSRSDKLLTKLFNSNQNMPITSRIFTRRSQQMDRVRSFKPNHRANDAIYLVGEAQFIRARFTLSSLDLVNVTYEKIRIDIQSVGGSWITLSTELTDSYGRINYRLPSHLNLLNGLHYVRLTPESDANHPVLLTLAIIPPLTEAVVFSVDGSFVANLSILGKDPKVQPGAVDVARHWHALGYLLIYISARPDMQRRRFANWMANHNFPHGLTFFLEGLCTDPLRQKAHLIRNIINKAKLTVHCAYGSGKDIEIYRSLGLNSYQIFVIGKLSRSQTSYGTHLSCGYASHLSDLMINSTLSRSAVGSMSNKIRCLSFNQPMLPIPKLSSADS